MSTTYQRRMGARLALFLGALVLTTVAFPLAARELAYGGVVSGKVLGPDGKPVEGAYVCIVVNAFALSEWDDFQVATKPDGSFSFRRLQENQYAALVFAVKPGYGVAALKIEDRRKRTGLTLRLTEGSPVDVVVTSTAGKPVSGATIRMYQGDWSQGVFIANFDCLKLTTDAEGKARIPWLGSNQSAKIQVTHPEHAFLEDDVRTPSKPLALQLPRAARITGRVVYAEGQRPTSVVGVYCQRLPEWEKGSDRMVTSIYPDENGEYVLDHLPPGDYRVWLQDHVRPSHLVGEPVKISGLREGATARCPEMELRPGAVFSGRVVDAKTGKGVEFARVYAWRTGGESWNRYFGQTADGDGRYHLRVPPGRWRLSVEADGYATRYEEQEREVKEGEESRNLRLTLSRR